MRPEHTDGGNYPVTDEILSTAHARLAGVIQSPLEEVRTREDLAVRLQGVCRAIGDIAVAKGRVIHPHITSWYHATVPRDDYCLVMQPGEGFALTARPAASPAGALLALTDGRRTRRKVLVPTDRTIDAILTNPENPLVGDERTTAQDIISYTKGWRTYRPFSIDPAARRPDDVRHYFTILQGLSEMLLRHEPGERPFLG